MVVAVELPLRLTTSRLEPLSLATQLCFSTTGQREGYRSPNISEGGMVLVLALRRARIPMNMLSPAPTLRGGELFYTPSLCDHVLIER